MARNDPRRQADELVERLHIVNTRAIDLAEALLLLSRAGQRSFTREGVDLSLVVEEATETLLPLAEKRAVTIQTSGEVNRTTGSHVLLLQMEHSPSPRVPPAGSASPCAYPPHPRTPADDGQSNCCTATRPMSGALTLLRRAWTALSRAAGGTSGVERLGVMSACRRSSRSVPGARRGVIYQHGSPGSRRVDPPGVVQEVTTGEFLGRVGEHRCRCSSGGRQLV
ncbi:hypothetical protein ACWDLG_24470 [Nonomuraea sp. NPDC003727]